MPDAPTPAPNRTKLAAAAALLGASAVAAFVLGAGPAPSVLQLAGASNDTAEDVSGNCDEAEHAADPECAGTPTSDADDNSGDDGTTSTIVDDSTSPTDDALAAPADGIHTLDASGSGTVIYAVEGGSLRLVSATPTSGWQVEVEQGTGPEIELDFRFGTQRVQVNVEFEDGQVRERVRLRDDADDTDVRTENGVVQADNRGPDSSGDDDTVDEDHSGSGHDGDDDSGSGSSGSGRDHPEDD
jgi:hypothetical protein